MGNKQYIRDIIDGKPDRQKKRASLKDNVIPSERLATLVIILLEIGTWDELPTDVAPSSNIN